MHILDGVKSEQKFHARSRRGVMNDAAGFNFFFLAWLDMIAFCSFDVIFVIL